VLHFENNKLARIVGDYYPQPPKEGEGKAKDPDEIITVPDWSAGDRTPFEKAMKSVGMDDDQQK
jgi:hypothetical protein